MVDLLDVLTPLSDCRHETVEKIMERRISGVSYMCWMDFHNTFLCCGFLCARLVSHYFVPILYLSFPATTPRATTSHPYHHGLSELSRSTTHVHRVITPAISNSYFVVYFSPAFTPPVLLHLHHHRGATRTNLLHKTHGSRTPA